MLRNDAAIARLCLMQARPGATMADFMPWPKQEEPEATLESLANLLRPAKKEKVK